MEEDEEEIMETPGFAWRVSLSIIVGVGWLVFLILWLTFYAAAFTVLENIVIIIVSVRLLPSPAITYGGGTSPSIVNVPQ